jgi:hypothetical protein
MLRADLGEEADKKTGTHVYKLCLFTCFPVYVFTTPPETP